MKLNASLNNGHEPAALGSEYLTKPEVAQLLRLTTRAIDTWMARGLLPYYKIGRTVRFRLSDIQDHLNNNCKVAGTGGR